MELREISIEVREGLGKGNAGRLRRGGFLPTSLYGDGGKNWTGKVNERDFVNIARKVSPSQLFSIKSSNSELNGRMAIVKEIQREFAAQKLLHIDMMVLNESKSITISVPLHVKGESPGVKNDGGVLNVAMYEIKLNCLPRQIPAFVEVDISKLELNESIHSGELKLPEGVTLHGRPDESVVSVVISKTQASVEAATTAAAATATTDTAATPAAGAAAPAAEGADKADKATKPEKSK